MGNASNAQEFGLQLDKVAEKFNVKMVDIFRAVSARAFENVVRRTPVGDPEYWAGHPKGNPSGKNKPPRGYVGGNAKNNWWFSLNSPNDQARGRSPDKANQNEALNSAVSGLATAQLGDVAHFQNGVPYILKLEAGTQSPRQAPAGMVAITMAEIETFYANIAAEVIERP